MFKSGAKVIRNPTSNIINKIGVAYTSVNSILSMFPSENPIYLSTQILLMLKFISSE